MILIMKSKENTFTEINKSEFSTTDLKFKIFKKKKKPVT